MYLEATCIDLTSEKIENILRNSKPINYKWLIGRIRKQIPSLYEKLCLDYYNPYQLQKMGWKVKGNSVIPINFAEDELVKYARDFLETEITNYQIIRIQLSQSRKMNKNLTQP